MVAPADPDLSDPSDPSERRRRPRRPRPPRGARRREAEAAAAAAAVAATALPVMAATSASSLPNSSAVPPPPPTNGAYGPGETIASNPTPIYVAGYRIPGDKRNWFLVANVSFVLVLVILTVFFLPMGIPFLAVKKAEGFLGYIGFFFTYMFGYFAFLILVLVTLGAGGYAVQQRYFA